jgi:hypothetical protein
MGWLYITRRQQKKTIIIIVRLLFIEGPWSSHRLFFYFFCKNVFAICKYTHLSTGQYKIVPGQPIRLQNTVRVVTGLPSGDGRYSSEIMAQRKITAGEGNGIRGECVWVVYVHVIYIGEENPVRCSPQLSGQRGWGGWDIVCRSGRSNGK